MIIKTQTGLSLVNTDLCDYICVDSQRRGISAKFHDGGLMKLAEYDSVDTCKKVLDAISLSMMNGFKCIQLPLGGEVDDWIK